MYTVAETASDISITIVTRCTLLFMYNLTYNKVVAGVKHNDSVFVNTAKWSPQ